MGADLASWYDTITSVRDVQNHETLAYRQIWYETLLLAHTPLSPLAYYPRRGSPKAGGEVFSLPALAGHLRQCQTAPKGRGLCCA